MGMLVEQNRYGILCHATSSNSKFDGIFSVVTFFSSSQQIHAISNPKNDLFDHERQSKMVELCMS